MKKQILGLLAIVAVAAPAFAGPTSYAPVVYPTKTRLLSPPPPENRFQEDDFSLDVFYSYNIAQKGNVFKFSSIENGDGGYDPDVFYTKDADYAQGQPACPKDAHFANGSGFGVGVTYFFTNYFGVGLDGNFWKGYHGGNTAEEHADWEDSDYGEEHPLPDKPKKWASVLTGNLMARYPFEFEDFSLAPYAFGGGGILWGGNNTHGFFDIGAGAEVRFTNDFGIFADWRYNFVNKAADFQTIRVGVRFVF